MRKLLYIFYLECKTNDWVGRKISFLLGHRIRTSSGNYLEMETCMVWRVTLHVSLSPFHPQWHLGGWMTLWSPEEMLDGQHQRVDIPALARTIHKGLLQKIWKKISAELPLMSPQWPNQSRGLTELNWRSEYSFTCFVYCQEFCLSDFLLFGSFNFMFSPWHWDLLRHHIYDKCQTLHEHALAYILIPFQWPWLYFKVTAVSNSFNRRFCVLILLKVETL